MKRVASIFLAFTYICFANESGIDAETALRYLKNGNVRYLKQNLRSDGQAQTDRNRLASGQHPHTIILSCSDSRVPPEVLFDQKLGEVFVVRVAGEALDSSVIASVEYAVEHLGVKQILVMGHTECGAVKAALTTPKGKSAGSPDLDKLVADIQPRVKADRKPASMSPHLVEESTANANKIATELPHRSKIIGEALETKGLKIRSSLYHIDTGKVDFLE